MNAKTPHNGGASNNHTQPTSTVIESVSVAASLPPLVGAVIQEQLRSLGGRVGTFALTGDKGKPCCIACRKFLRQDGHEQLGSVSAYASGKIILHWSLCLDCAKAANLTGKTQAVTP